MQLPDILDLLVISVEAGLGFEQALERTTTAVPGPLSDEFRRMLQETRIGATPRRRAAGAGRAVRGRRAAHVHPRHAPGRHVRCVGLADPALAGRRDAHPPPAARQEQAQKAPVKMLFPLVFCIFPSIFVVILGPGDDPAQENF